MNLLTFHSSRLTLHLFTLNSSRFTAIPNGPFVAGGLERAVGELSQTDGGHLHADGEHLHARDLFFWGGGGGRGINCTHNPHTPTPHLGAGRITTKPPRHQEKTHREVREVREVREERHILWEASPDADTAEGREKNISPQRPQRTRRKNKPINPKFT